MKIGDKVCFKHNHNWVEGKLIETSGGEQMAFIESDDGTLYSRVPVREVIPAYTFRRRDPVATCVHRRMERFLKDGSPL